MADYRVSIMEDLKLGSPLLMAKTQESNTQRDAKSIIKQGKKWGFKRYLGYSAWVLLAISIQLVVGSCGSKVFPDGKPACNTNDPTHNISVCNLVEVLAAGENRLRTLAAFILGGFLASSVGMWIKRRSAYCALCGSTRNILINLCSIVRDERDRKLLARWAVLGYELSILKARGMMDHAEGKKYLEDLRLLAGSEWNDMVDGDRHTTVWFWIQLKCDELLRSGDIAGLQFQTLCQAVTLSRDRANDLMSPIDRDQPLPYTYVCGLLVNMNLMLLSLSTGFKWCLWMYDTDGSVWTHPKMYADIFMLFMSTSIYSMLFDLCTILYNPFGPRKYDIKHFQVGRGIRLLAKALCHCKRPSTMDNQSGSLSASLDVMDLIEEEEAADNRVSQYVLHKANSSIKFRSVVSTIMTRRRAVRPILVEA